MTWYLYFRFLSDLTVLSWVPIFNRYILLITILKYYIILLWRLIERFSSRRQPIGKPLMICDGFSLYYYWPARLTTIITVDIVTSGLLSLTVVVKTGRKPTAVSRCIVSSSVAQLSGTSRLGGEIPWSIFIADDF